MEFTFAQLLFWPCMIASIILSLIGIYLKKSSPLFVSAALIVPLSIYLIDLFSIGSLVLPLLYVCAAQAIHKKKTWLATLFSIPIYALIGWIGYLVLTQ
ncbi:hypothetical protein AALF16_11865 [Bacillus cereus]|uniref:hypothetical protein n=1 Tax=Bacillus cereus TaxID=1396 RepID=UPI00356F4CA6